MLLFVGLGNPGARFKGHRHNVGFMAVDKIIHRHSFSPEKKKFQSLITEGRLDTEKVLIIKPQTFMNESGRAVNEATKFYKIPPEDVIVFYDELDLAFGKIKVKQGGGAAGHNGIRSISNHIGTDFIRVRIGIGHPGIKEKVTSHVLGDFSKAEQPDLNCILCACADHADLLAKGDAPHFMNKVALVTNEIKKSAADQTAVKTEDIKPNKKNSTPENQAPKQKESQKLGPLAEFLKVLKGDK